MCHVVISLCGMPKAARPGNEASLSRNTLLSKLSKGSDDNWSKTLYKIGKVMRKQGTRAERYRLVKKAKVSEDTIYTRNDLQKVDVNTLEKIPTKQKKATRAQVEKDKD